MEIAMDTEGMTGEFILVDMFLYSVVLWALEFSSNQSLSPP